MPQNNKMIKEITNNLLLWKIISLIFLVYILYLKSNVANKILESFFNFIKFIFKVTLNFFIILIRKIFNNLNYRILLNKLKLFFKNKSKYYLDASLFVLLFFLILFFSTSSFNLILNLSLLNFKEYTQKIALPLIIITIMWAIAILMYSSYKFQKEKIYLFIILILIFLIPERIINKFFILTVFMCLLIIFLYPFLLIKKEWKKPNFWIISTALVIFFLLYSGLFLISGIYKYKEIETSNLYSDKNVSNIYGELNCSNKLGRMVVGSEIKCMIFPPFNISVAHVDFISDIGEINGPYTYNDLTFSIPENTTNINFMIVGKDIKINKTRLLNSNTTFKVYTYEEYQKIKNDIIKTILGLFGIVLFSIPFMMFNFKELSKKNAK
jgi:hypothetical protein